MRILHFADAHIDIANRGRHDPATGIPMRVLDFLRALDKIVDTAIDEKVDLVLFAGDAYKDRSPAPTFQREWDRRIARLSQAGIPTVLLVGNHDLSPAVGRAHALQEFNTLGVRNVLVIDRPELLGPEKLDGLPLQIIAIPWISRSALIGNYELSGVEPAQIITELENRYQEWIGGWIEQADPNMPLILTAHTTVQGAVYGSERGVMLGADLVLPASLVRDPHFSYVALGHIHKAQDLNKGAQPPVVYPGSIERVDFGEAKDDKFFVIAHVEPGQPTHVDWRRLDGRVFIDRLTRLNSLNDLPAASEPEAESGLPDPQRLLAAFKAALPDPADMQDAIVRLTVEYPRPWEPLIDEQSLRAYVEPAFEFHLVRRPQLSARARLAGDDNISRRSPQELLNTYWDAFHIAQDDVQEMNRLADDIIHSVSHDPTESASSEPKP